MRIPRKRRIGRLFYCASGMGAILAVTVLAPAVRGDRTAIERRTAHSERIFILMWGNELGAPICAAMIYEYGRSQVRNQHFALFPCSRSEHFNNIACICDKVPRTLASVQPLHAAHNWLAAAHSNHPLVLPHTVIAVEDAARFAAWVLEDWSPCHLRYNRSLDREADAEHGALPTRNAAQAILTKMLVRQTLAARRHT